MPATVEGLGLHSEDIVGKTVLNVGSSQGDLCIAAMKLGAARAVGVELRPGRIHEARAKAHVGASQAEFIEADFEGWEGTDTFDVVICSNILHQTLDPIHALRRMMRIARETLVIEFTTPALNDVRKYGVSLAALFGARSALIAPARARYGADLYSRTFLLTAEAICTIVNGHSAAFDPVKIAPSPRPGRLVASARRRRIGHLTVLAGPTAAGKGTLYEALDADFRHRLGIPEAQSSYVTASEARTLAPGPHEHVVLHYDLLRPFETSLQSYDRDVAVDLIRAAHRVTFVTIFVDPERLQRQITASELAERSPAKQSARHLKIRELYKDRGFLADWYGRWLHFCQQFSGKTAGSFFVHNRGDYAILPASADTLRSLLAHSADDTNTRKAW